ncbi:hypothetical protein BH23CHL2_BH23CHL2_12810 [soil metagenome]
MSTILTSHRYHVILPDVTGRSALACVSANGLVLPNWVSGDPPFWEDAPRPVNRQMRELFRANVAMLRVVSRDWSPERRETYFLVENLDPAWQPPTGSCWISADDIESADWRDDADRQVLAGWFHEQPAPGRVAWYQPGWFDQARDWILFMLDRKRIRPAGEVEQLRSWERSSVMSVETDAGMIYFKAVPPQWGHEPGLTEYLSRRFPAIMPDVVAAAPDLGRMLIREFPGKPLPDSADPTLWARAYETLGRVQRELTGSIDQLRTLGVPHRGPEVLIDRIPGLLRDDRLMRLGLEGGLTGAEAESLRLAEHRLIAACARLAASPVPLSLDHGDFWPGNIYADQGSVTLFDWSDATLTHPFFSLVMAADEIAECLGGVPGAADPVIDAYLRQWLDFGSIDDLRAIFADAMLVAPLHLAAMYRDAYLPAMEFVEELDRMTPHFLRWLAKRLQECSL